MGCVSQPETDDHKIRLYKSTEPNPSSRFLDLCRTVIRDILLPLVAKYGQSIGLWEEYFPGHGLDVRDEDFTDFLEEEFHQDFKLAGTHCAHVRQAIASLKKEHPAELNTWIDKKLRKYLKLKTVVRDRSGEALGAPILPGPRDRFFEKREQAEEVVA